MKSVSSGVIICRDLGVSDIRQFRLAGTPMYAISNTIPINPSSFLTLLKG